MFSLHPSQWRFPSVMTHSATLAAVSSFSVLPLKLLKQMIFFFFGGAARLSNQSRVVLVTLAFGYLTHAACCFSTLAYCNLTPNVSLLNRHEGYFKCLENISLWVFTYPK